MQEIIKPIKKQSDALLAATSVLDRCVCLGNVSFVWIVLCKLTGKSNLGAYDTDMIPSSNMGSMDSVAVNEADVSVLQHFGSLNGIQTDARAIIYHKQAKVMTSSSQNEAV